MKIYLFTCMLLVCHFDIRRQIIPDEVTLMTALPALHFGLHGASLIPAAIWIGTALLASAAGHSMPYGLGDAKLLSAIALSFGAEILLRTYVCASIAAGIFCALLLLTGKAKKKDRIAFGPFIALGFILCLPSI